MSRSPRRPPAEPAAARRPGVPGLPVVVLATLAVLVTAADTYVVVLALPDILAGVGVGLDELQRATPIIGGFLLGYTATLPLLGRLADLRGRVPVLVGCLLLFALGSLLTATADALGPAVLGRGLQGIGAGGLVPATLALVADRWPPERRALPLGVVGAVQEAGAVLGPLAGAAVLALADWRAIFWLNLLLGLGLAVGVAGHRPADGGPIRSGWCSPSLTGRRARRCSWPQPAALAEDVTLGLLYVPVVPALALYDAAGADRRSLAGAGLVARSLAVPGRRRPAAARTAAAGPRGRRARLGAGRRRASAASCWAFAAADPATQVVAHGPVLLPLARGRRRRLRAARAPHRRRRSCRCGALRPTGAWGALVVNLLVGVALVAALVDVPLFARNTTTPGRPARRRAGAAAAAGRRPGRRGGRRLAVPRPRPARWSPRAGWRCRARLRRDDDVGCDLAGRRRVVPSSWSPRGSASGWPSRRSTPSCWG